jgi:hypothetical protein
MKLNALNRRIETNVLKENNVKRIVILNEKFQTWHQRLVLGVASLSTQPLFDYYNKNVDHDTRKYSTARTIAKIVVGTTEGCIVRALAIKHGGKYAYKVLKNPEFRANIEKQFEKITKEDLSKPNNKFVLMKKAMSKWSTEYKNDTKTFEKLDLSKMKKDSDIYPLAKMINEAGNVIAVASAFLAALVIDVPVTNKALNKLMEVMFPNFKKEGNK